VSHFRVGDRVVIVRAARNPANIGRQACVTSELIPCVDGGWDWPAGTRVHIIEAADGELFSVTPSWIEPYRDDGSERGEWDELTRRVCKVSEDA